MKKFLLALGVFALSGVGAFAQSDDYKKGEFFVGYSHQRVDTGISDDDGDLRDFIREREGFNGFNVSGVYNVHRYVGLKADISGAYKGREYNVIIPGEDPVNVSFDLDASIYNFLGGVQFKDNSSDAKVKPFAHLLAGAGHGRAKVSNLNCSEPELCVGFAGTTSETGWAGAFGGGIDIKLSDRVDFRAIQVDYNPMRLGGETTHNVRFGIGFVFR